MDLSTNYLGLTLAHPFMVGASPLAGNLTDGARRLERRRRGGSRAALAVREEQVDAVAGRDSSPGSARPAVRGRAGPLPGPGQCALTPDRYLEHIRQLKDAVQVRWWHR